MVFTDPNEVHLWWGNTRQGICCTEWLSAEEKSRADGYRISEARRKVFEVARAALRLALSQYLKIAPAEIPIAIDERGKPFLVGNPLAFSVSHSGEEILIGISPLSAVGVDIEKIDPSRALERLARRFYHPEENLALGEIISAEKFFRVWTRKEAYLKLEGGGIDRELREFSVLESAPPGTVLVSLDGPVGYAAALATYGTRAARMECHYFSSLYPLANGNR